MAWNEPRARTRLLLVGLVLAHLVVISRQVDGGGGQTLFQSVIFSIFSPPQRIVGGAIHGVGGLWDHYADLRGVERENDRLKLEQGELNRELQALRAAASETERLRELLGLSRILPHEVIAAEIVARQGVPWFRTITIDRGSQAGVELNAAVISATGIVGRVVAVGPFAARVQLLLDRDCGVGVMIESTGVSGVVSGQVGLADSGATDLLMNYVPGYAEIAEGDVVVSSGLDRIFPKGLMVGRVSWVGEESGLFREIRVAPTARFDRLEHVLVLAGLKPEPELTQSVQ
jgi:rod shape-determining protein MreC